MTQQGIDKYSIYVLMEKHGVRRNRILLQNIYKLIDHWKKKSLTL